jgi:hypothetical protein
MCTSPKYYKDDQGKEREMDRTRSTHSHMKNTKKFWSDNLKGGGQW